ncbi:MAG: energy-coupled thiamine transporter ThiT [Lachnospiraceae bacterium]|nr:energy-coupled thiamine transporter ThiT [Lachnospiraceae bacterium]
MKQNYLREIVFSAIAIALATVVSVVLKLPSLPFGGSVTLFSMLIICLPGYWFGFRTGIIAALAYGTLQLLFDPYIVHPLQLLLDYPLAFGALGLSGLFHKSKNGLLIGYIVGVAGRFVMHMISGLIYFTEYVPDLKGNIAAVWGSTLYNMSYIVPELVITCILLALPPVAALMKQLKTMAAK